MKKKFNVLLVIIFATSLFAGDDIADLSPYNRVVSIDGIGSDSDSRSSVCRSCMTDVGRYRYESAERIARRFEIYKEIGVDMLRVEGLEWGRCEVSPGKWQHVKEMDNYINMLKKYKFKIKLIAGTIMCPPGWYIENNPDVRMINENGYLCRNTLNYWNPEIRPKLEEVVDKLFDYYDKLGIMPYVEQVVVDFGQAGEPLYPPAWTLGPKYKGPETFWMYNRLAHEDFRRAMKAKYEFIEIANSVWGTDFQSWEEVMIVQPGKLTGPYWYDVLIRYRDVKRDFEAWQIGNFQRVLKRYKGRVKPVVYLAGRDERPKMWAEAVGTGEGHLDIKLMCDLRWLARTAIDNGCMLQYTGAENRAEVEYLVKYLRDNNLKYEMWGENAGVFQCANEPLKLADIVIKNDLYGIDYTHSHFMFKTTGSPKPAWEETKSDIRNYSGDIEVNPEVAPDLEKAYRMIREHYGEE